MCDKTEVDYKNTLNLPVTDFPMRAKLYTREPKIFQKWQDMGLDKKILENRSKDKRYTLHDGPPYANGDIHIGHALNKILKDILVRYKTMQGYYSHYVPGWDCHGLPIEQKVRKKLGKKAREMSIVDIRKLCTEYANSWVEKQSEQFLRLGIGGDFANPYKTLNPEYEVGILKAFRALVENDMIYRGRKPVYWCISCRTALADAEVEYDNHKSHSIYVRFPVLNKEKIEGLIDIDNPKIVIWTTTPWTLPANVAVTLHPDFKYVAARIKSSGETFIIAKDLLEKFLSDCELEEAEILGKWKGSELEGLKCSHPLLEKESVVVCGRHVTLEQGTGCVHTAPGHGYDDYIMLLQHNLQMVMPVDDAGRFTEEFPLMEGTKVWAANVPIIEKLKEDGLLVHDFEMEHSYPHCWRCNKPIIYRATEQWFMSVDKNDLRKKALKAIDDVEWIPSWGKGRIFNMLKMRPDWCLSRQRKWGVPIPAIRCKDCEATQLDLEVIDKFIEQVSEKGTDAWFSEAVESILPENYKCPECGSTSMEKNSDTLDVWFDSGSSHIAVCEQIEDLGSPADLYLEGSDQHRGWFQSSLLIGLGARGHAP
jgi:isoleucyl-tRNA synthetase